MRFSKLAAAFLVSVGLAPSAFALDPGVVTHLSPEPGAVLVLRDSEVFELKQGDAIFVGDKIFTRTYGTVRFNIADCSFSLGGRQSFDVQENACAGTPINLAGDAVIAGVQIGVYGPAPGIGATPALLGLLLAGGGVAAAAAANESGSPASP